MCHTIAAYVSRPDNKIDSVLNKQEPSPFAFIFTTGGFGKDFINTTIAYCMISGIQYQAELQGHTFTFHIIQGQEPDNPWTIITCDFNIGICTLQIIIGIHNFNWDIIYIHVTPWVSFIAILTT